MNVLDNSISKFDSSGGFLSSITTNLSNPEALAFDSSGNLYASNFNTSSISKFDSSGTFLSTISSTGNLWDPRGLAFDSSGNLYASDTDDLIKKFDSSGTFLSTIGTGNLNAPWGVVFDSSGNLYASNVGDNSISKFDSAGNFVFSWSLADTPSFMAFGPAPVPVPEPSNWILGTIATATFGFMARRNRMIRKA